MFAIQTGDKFLSVRYFLDPNEGFDTSITGKPKTWKTREEAETHLARARVYFAARMSHLSKIASESHKKAAQAQERVIKLKAELEVLVELPYNDVHVEVDRKRKELDRCESNALDESMVALDYTRAFKRFEKLADADYRVVTIVLDVVDGLAD